MKRYTVFDVETPNSNNDKICSISLTYIVDSEIVGSYSTYINPETHFNEKNIQIHGITQEMIINSPTFNIVWNDIKNDFINTIVVAHNATFDLSVLAKTLRAYNLPLPNINYICTCNLARSLNTGAENNKLNTLCEKFDIDLFCHHDAECDSQACAELFLCFCSKYNLDTDNLYKKYTCSSNYKENKRINLSYTEDTQSLQLLQGILIGITSDNVLNENEIISLNSWLKNNTHLKGNYPFDRVFDVVSNALEDGILEKSELDEMLCLFNQFINPSETFCEKCDSININGKNICLTGEFENISRSDLEIKLKNQGAQIKGVSKNIDYLVIGSLGSERYANGNYGSKTKKAIEMNDKGANIIIMNEQDFLKAAGMEK